MTRIRYASLPEGLHAQARWEGGRTILYLRPGLTSEQRREALRRAQQTARMGHGPRLPAASLALALAADRITATMRNALAAVRHHPLGTGMLAALVAGAVVSYSLFVTVTVRLIYPQVPGVVPSQPHPSVPVPTAAPGSGSGGQHSPGSADSPSPGTADTPSPAAAGGHPSPSATSPAPTPAPPPSPSAVPSPKPSPVLGVCVKVAGVGVCLNL